MSQPITRQELLESFDSFLIDAYGVSVRGGEVIPGALEFISKLKDKGKEFLVLSNDASRLPQSSWQKYHELGFKFDPEDILTSAMMIKPYFEASNLQGRKTLVIGPEDSHVLAKKAGARLVEPFEEESLEAVVICDERQGNLIECLNYLASQILSCDSRENLPKIILANPDYVYPIKSEVFGITAGSLGLMVEKWLEMRFGEVGDSIVQIGKPSPFIFKQALAKLTNKNPVMIGDQIYTDIAGANSMGLKSCLSLMGITGKLEDWHLPKPDFILNSWDH